MANISLNKSTRTCKVNTGWADRIASDRFLNSDLMQCPVWSGRDLAGRSACADSFYTKRAGCNTSLDRINVENNLRPQYMEFITLDACGINGEMYGEQSENIGVTEGYARTSGKMSSIRENYVPYQDALDGCASLNQIPKYTGQFGQGNFRADIEPTCSQYSYEQAMAESAQANRSIQMVNAGARYQGLRRAGL